MTDYYPVIARCVADLEGSIAARHEFYWLARAELAVQLCSLDPPLTQSEIMRERLALAEAIRRVEAEYLPPIGASPTQPRRMSLPGSQGMRGFADNRLCPDIRAGIEPGQRQASGGPTLKSPSTSSRLPIAFAGVLLALGLAFGLYGRGHLLTLLVDRSSAALPHLSVKSSATVIYYVDQLSELASRAIRRAKVGLGTNRLMWPSYSASENGRSNSPQNSAR